VASTRPDAPVLRVAQITDMHLHATPDGELLGLNTRHCLQEVIALAEKRRPQLVIATGDLTHDGAPAAYQALRVCFSHLDAPVYCLPGNHDEADALAGCLRSSPCHHAPSLQLGGWQFVFLDSTVKGSDAGHLAASELARLDATLARAPELPAIVWLHHQPVTVGSRWLDSMAISNPTDFFQIIDRHAQVRAVVWGHVHQCFEQHHGNVRLLASPSTCIQFLPHSDDFAVDHAPPGYRWFELYGDGRITTGVERLAGIPGVIDASVRGY
jgi:Icc protein